MYSGHKRGLKEHKPADLYTQGQHKERYGGGEPDVRHVTGWFISDSLRSRIADTPKAPSWILLPGRLVNNQCLMSSLEWKKDDRGKSYITLVSHRKRQNTMNKHFDDNTCR